MLIEAIGGLGVFLLGMIIMTQGLTSLAGDTVRNALMSFTRSPLSGALTGTCTTAILQSSSATTVAAVGFVSAGLLTYPQALGIIFGANLGTTITGWMVLLVGFKLQLGTLLLPVILVGSLLRLFGRDQLAETGMALAGFGLIFVGIAFMQQGMTGLENLVTPERLPADSLVGRLQLVLIGMLVTAITQSSSAGVAAALTALYTGNINFHQAAALVIGMDIGTTVTALLSTIGRSVPGKRTGFSHCLYNLITASVALLLLTPFVVLWEALSGSGIVNDAEIALVTFHSLFNCLGIILVLPFTDRFAGMMYRLIPDRELAYSEKLDDKLLEQPDLALYSLQQSATSQFRALLHYLTDLLTDKGKGSSIDLDKLAVSLEATYRFTDKLHLQATQSEPMARLLAVIHANDHLQRLHERCEEEYNRAIVATQSSQLKAQHDTLLECLKALDSALEKNDWAAVVEHSRRAHTDIHTSVESIRHSILEEAATGAITVIEATAKLQALRWLDRVSWHIARISHHTRKAWSLSGLEKAASGHN